MADAKPVLVPLDGTLLAEQAFPLALSLARSTGAEVHPVLVHLVDYFVDPATGLGAVPDADRAQERREAEYLESVEARLSAADVPVRAPALLHGEVADSVAAYVAEHGIELVVMATHGRGAFERLLVPSVAEGLRRRVRVPMILLRGDADAGAPEALRPAPTPRTVLVALDGSADGEAALEAALALAGPEARYVLLRVASLPPQLSTTYLPRAAMLRHSDEVRLKEEAAAYLEEVEARVRSRARDVEKRTGVHSRPGRLVLHAAEEVGADLIALGGHGHGILREALFGSVAHDVLAEAGVPVLVARGSAPTP